MFSSHYLSRNILNRLMIQCRLPNQRNPVNLDFRSKVRIQNKLINNATCIHRTFCSNSDDKVKVNYILKDGSKVTINASIGQNVMEVAQENEIDIEGACAASLACCTCHVYVKQEYFDKLGEICDLEEDMLDQAPLLKENSRLSCQIVLTKELDDIEVQLPNVTRNFYVDGHKPSHH